MHPEDGPTARSLRLAASEGIALAILVLAVACSRLASFPAQSPMHQFNLPADEADASLRRFAEQADREIIYSPDSVHGVRTNAVRGTYTVGEAIDRLLTGTALAAVQSENGAIAVSRRLKAAAPPRRETTRTLQAELHGSPRESMRGGPSPAPSILAAAR